MGRPKGSTNRNKVAPVTVDDIITSEYIDPKNATSLETAVAALLARYCGIPGCVPRNHLGAARSIIQLVRNGG